MRLHFRHQLDTLTHTWRLPTPWICHHYDLALVQQLMHTPHRIPTHCTPHQKPT